MNWIETAYHDALGAERPIYINLAQVRYIKRSDRFTLVVFTQSQTAIRVLMPFQDFMDAIDNQEPQAAANAATIAASPPQQPDWKALAAAYAYNDTLTAMNNDLVAENDELQRQITEMMEGNNNA